MANGVLANEPLAAAKQPPDGAPSEDDYRAFCAALEASARGRAFLAEYARRNRHADTEMVLAALDRLETLVRSQTATAEADRIRQELRALLAAMRTAQPVIDASAAAIKAAKLAALIGFVQHRIESIVAAREHPPLPAEVIALVMAHAPAADTARAHLAVVPQADEPELPMPSPAAALAPAIVPEPPKPEPEFTQAAPQPIVETPQPIAEAIAPSPARPTAAIMPEVTLFDSEPAKPAVDAPVVEEAAAQPAMIETVVVATVALEPAAVETVIATMIELPQTELVEEAFAAPPAPAPVVQPETVERMPADDPLALIMALSEAERIALFT